MGGVTLGGGRELAARLDAMPGRIHDLLLNKATALALELEAKVQAALSGGVLNVRSGALRRSIVARVEDNATAVLGAIASSGDVKSAAIHEFGGTIPAHEIVPNKAKALAFAVNGKQAFAARVFLPAIAMPERSYLRSSLVEMADPIREELRETVIAAMR